MSKKSNYVIAEDGNKAFMCEEDDPRLENIKYRIITGRFDKDKEISGDKKVLGIFKASNKKVYVVHTDRRAYEMEVD